MAEWDEVQPAPGVRAPVRPAPGAVVPQIFDDGVGGSATRLVAPYSGLKRSRYLAAENGLSSWCLSIASTSVSETFPEEG